MTLTIVLLILSLIFAIIAIALYIAKYMLIKTLEKIEIEEDPQPQKAKDVVSLPLPSDIELGLDFETDLEDNFIPKELDLSPNSESIVEQIKTEFKSFKKNNK